MVGYGTPMEVIPNTKLEFMPALLTNFPLILKPGVATFRQNVSTGAAAELTGDEAATEDTIGLGIRLGVGLGVGLGVEEMTGGTTTSLEDGDGVGVDEGRTVGVTTALGDSEGVSDGVAEGEDRTVGVSATLEGSNGVAEGVDDGISTVEEAAGGVEDETVTGSDKRPVHTWATTTPSLSMFLR
jgi:hypothetical protein